MPVEASDDEHGPAGASEPDVQSAPHDASEYQVSAEQYHAHSETPIMPAITDPQHETTIDLSEVSRDFTCPICLSVMRSTVTTMLCCHRFCEDCITKSLRLGNKECPTCRVKCSSRRALRPDKAFDTLIAVLYPDLAAHEQKEHDTLDEVSIHHIRTFQQNMKDIVERQQKNKHIRIRPLPPTQRPDAEEYPSPAGKRKRGGDDAASAKRRRVEEERETIYGPQDEGPAVVVNRIYQPGADVSFQLVRHPREHIEPSLKKSYITTKVECTVSHLIAFLSLKLKGSAARKRYAISVDVGNSGGDPVVLPAHTTLLEICNDYWNQPNTPLVVYYSRASLDMDI